MRQPDLYQILGLDHSATAGEARRAYRKLAKIHHPDAGGDEELFEQIKLAHDVLTDPARREKYDRTGSVDHEVDAIGGRAMEMLFSVFMGCVGEKHPVEARDLIAETIDALKSGAKTQRNSIEALDRQVTKLSAVVARLKRKGKAEAPSALQRMVQNQIDGLAPERAAMEQNLAAFERAIELAAEHEFHFEERPEIKVRVGLYGWGPS